MTNRIITCLSSCCTRSQEEQRVDQNPPSSNPIPRLITSKSMVSIQPPSPRVESSASSQKSLRDIPLLFSGNSNLQLDETQEKAVSAPDLYLENISLTDSTPKTPLLPLQNIRSTIIFKSPSASTLSFDFSHFDPPPRSPSSGEFDHVFLQISRKKQEVMSVDSETMEVSSNTSNHL